MNQMLKKLIMENFDKMDSRILWEKGCSLGGLSIQQKQVFHDVLVEVLKELSPSFKGGILLVLQVLMQVIVSHCSKNSDK